MHPFVLAKGVWDFKALNICDVNGIANGTEKLRGLVGERRVSEASRLLETRMNPSYILPMRQSPKKLLAILLALLVGLIPLQAAMAGFADSFGQGDGAHQMADRHDGSQAMADPVMGQDCEHCKADTGNGHSCSSGHCVSCVLGLLPSLSFSTHQSATSVQFRTVDGFVRRLSSSLFRPPRA